MAQLRSRSEELGRHNRTLRHSMQKFGFEFTLD